MPSPTLGLLPHYLLELFAETDALVSIVIVFNLQLVDLRCLNVAPQTVKLLVALDDLAALLADRPFIAVVHLLVLCCRVLVISEGGHIWCVDRLSWHEARIEASVAVRP